VAGCEPVKPHRRQFCLIRQGFAPIPPPPNEAKKEAGCPASFACPAAPDQAIF
jgi:hypothetical protein